MLSSHLLGLTCLFSLNCLSSVHISPVSDLLSLHLLINLLIVHACLNSVQLSPVLILFSSHLPQICRVLSPVLILFSSHLFQIRSVLSFLKSTRSCTFTNLLSSYLSRSGLKCFSSFLLRGQQTNKKPKTKRNKNNENHFVHALHTVGSHEQRKILTLVEELTERKNNI